VFKKAFSGNSDSDREEVGNAIADEERLKRGSQIIRN
jgi:hypothetical protein